MEQNNEITVTQKSQEVTELNIFGSVQGFEIGQRMAKVFAQSTLVPQSYQGNIGNCLIGMNIAARMHADPLMVFQNLVVVHGTPTFEAKFAISCFNATGKYTPIRYEEIGNRNDDSYGMYAYAIDKATGDLLKGPEITIKMAKDEGWFARNTKWKSIPQLMLRYRAASWFIRTTDPGVMMGFQTCDEVEDVEYAEIVPEASKQSVPMQTNEAHTQEPVEFADIMNTSKTDSVESADKKKTQKTDEKKTQPIGKQELPDIFSEN